MSDMLTGAIAYLDARLQDGTFDGNVRVVIAEEGCITIDGSGARACPEDDGGDADCTVRTDSETFRALSSGSLDPMSAYLGGRIRVDGEFAAVLKLGRILL